MNAAPNVVDLVADWPSTTTKTSTVTASSTVAAMRIVSSWRGPRIDSVRSMNVAHAPAATAAAMPTIVAPNSVPTGSSVTRSAPCATQTGTRQNTDAPTRIHATGALRLGRSSPGDHGVSAHSQR